MLKYLSIPLNGFYSPQTREGKPIPGELSIPLNGFRFPDLVCFPAILPFNSIEWILGLPARASSQQRRLLSFNSIEWIRSGKFSFEESEADYLSIPLNGFPLRLYMEPQRGLFYAFNSIEWILEEIVKESLKNYKKLLSIPLNGFADVLATPGTGIRGSRFQFH